jgi:hypothetical protein
MPLGGVSGGLGGLGGLALGVETSGGWGAARPTVADVNPAYGGARPGVDAGGLFGGGRPDAGGAYGGWRVGGVNTEVGGGGGGGVIGRPDSTASLVNAESASSWSADSTAAFGGLATQVRRAVACL